ncbi:MAG: helix-turn-helix domain-containing protein [Nocardioidaceae bacterium]
MAGGRRGRPYQVPEDNTSLRAPTVDVNARVGWLLLMSRLHSADEELASGEVFNHRLAAVGLRADRSAVSRWESGKVTPRYSVLQAYEQALSLRPGQLTSTVNALRRAFGGENLPAWTPVFDPSSTDFHASLDALFDRLLSDRPGVGSDWTSLAHHIAATDVMYVHGQVWRNLTAKLIDEMTRGVGIAYLQRFEAVRLLLDHSRAQPWLLHATGDFLADPAVQVINDPMGVLEVCRAPEAARVVLDQFVTTRSWPVVLASLGAVGIKLDEGAYSDEQIDLIERTALARIEEAEGTAAGFEELVVSMPEPARSRMLKAAQGLVGHEELAQAAAHGERFSPDTTRRVSQRIADKVRALLPAGTLYDDDRLTPRLIREALFAARSNHMHYAAIALVGSQLRSGLATVLADEIDHGGLDDPMSPRYAHLLRYVVETPQEEAVLRWLQDASAEMARDFAIAIGHLPSDRSLDELLPLIDREGSPMERRLLYALGMRQSPLLDKIRDDESRPVAVRDAARWWIRQGGHLLT